MIRRIFNSIQPNLNDSLLLVFFCNWYTTGTSLLTNGTESVFHRERKKKKKEMTQKTTLLQIYLILSEILMHINHQK